MGGKNSDPCPQGEKQLQESNETSAEVSAIDEEEAKHEFEYVATKLGIPVVELQGYFEAPNMTYKDYNNKEAMFNSGAKVLKWLGIERSIKR